MNKRNYLKDNWEIEPIQNIIKILKISIGELLEIALEMNLQKIKSADEVRRWTKDEEDFLKKYSNLLSIKEASNLLHRSRYATYQRVKYLGLEEMINKKKVVE